MPARTATQLVAEVSHHGAKVAVVDTSNTASTMATKVAAAVVVASMAARAAKMAAKQPTSTQPNVCAVG